MRHQNGSAASQDEVPPRASSAVCSSPLPYQTYTSGVMALLQPSQQIPVSDDGAGCSFWTSEPPSPPAVAGEEDMDDFPAACTAEVENTSPAFLAPSRSSRPARRSVAAASPPITSQAKQQLSVSDELRARTKEDSRKNREHLLRMRLLRAESRDKAEKRKQVHDLEV
ncbi:uncharacterized protein LOC144175437 [Haemaphysalis longicornis]